MTLRKTPSILIFDVNETLLDLTSLEPFFARVFGEARVMREWFAQLVLYSQTMTLSGSYATFGDLAQGVLRRVGTTSGVVVTDKDVAGLKKAIGSMGAVRRMRTSLRSPYPTLVSGRKKAAPFGESSGAGLFVGAAVLEMALRRKVVMNRGMN